MDVIYRQKTQVRFRYGFLRGKINNLLKTKTKQKFAQPGIGRKFQKPTVFEEQNRVRQFGTVTEKRQSEYTPTLFSRLTPTQIRPERIDEVLKTVGLGSHRFYVGGGYCLMVNKQWFWKIGHALAADPRLLLIDERRTGMTAQGNRAQTSGIG